MLPICAVIVAVPSLKPSILPPSSTVTMLLSLLDHFDFTSSSAVASDGVIIFISLHSMLISAVSPVTITVGCLLFAGEG